MTKDNIAKSQIDKIRDSAASFHVGDDSDGAVTSLITVNDRLYVIKERAIYTVALADDIDPDRTRADIPNTIQKFFDLGSDHEIVVRILLTATELFKEGYLVEGIDHEALMSHVMDCLLDLGGAYVISRNFKLYLAEARKDAVTSKDNSASIPSYPSLRSDVKSFIQKIDHFVQDIFGIIIAFYDEQTIRKSGPWLDGLAEYLRTSSNNTEEFAMFAKEFAEFGKMARNIRHCIEHPKPDQRIELLDFCVTANRTLEEPTIAVKHKTTPVEATHVSDFMNFFYQQALAGSEVLMAFLAGHHTKSFGKFPIIVGEIPEAQRQNRVRYGYLIKLGASFQRLG
ncbi:hypothetical protein E2A64_04860 [Pseudohoeflea suaedae]|uniref:Uncharacterized protein n=1 Tax=Pseudohoeflea suaedae TaxID=877384 RepID=A0A4R5PN52_9HYPH|nr:hypothetical protein [Pseudohoeflea suaedae]TDH38446.1 hypothetical protein E2A64_04860 [Pseudohoeflea suaedae]